MKKFFSLVAIFMAVMLFIPQTYALAKKNESSTVSQKAIKKQAKQKQKEGWKVPGGTLPLELQWAEAVRYKGNRDKYIVATARVITESYDAGRKQAIFNAKNAIASAIGSDIVDVITGNADNQQISPEDAATVNKMVSATKSIVVRKLGRTNVVYEAYRVLPNKNIEIEVQVAYDVEDAKEQYKETLRQELEKESEKLANELDSILGF